MEYSFFETILYRPLFNVLLLIYKFLGFESIGWAVIVLIIVIRLATWPLFSQSTRYQRLMQKIQPEISDAQKKNKGNLEEQGKAVMGIYKKYNLHPASYFILILVQIPIFIALAGLFFKIKDNLVRWQYSFIELGHQVNLHFLGFDLAAPSLILLAVALVLQSLQSFLLLSPQQRKNPATFLLPLVFGAILYKLPSVFFLYWTATSLFSIAQQELLKLKESRRDLSLSVKT